MGGIGKTTLAQRIYNDAKVQTHFEKRIWVCVSDPYDGMQVAKSVANSLHVHVSNSVDLQNLLEHIKEPIANRRFLSCSMMCGLWTEEADDREPLLYSLESGASGSQVLVTTRSAKCSTAIRSTYTHLLGILPEEESWKCQLQEKRWCRGEGKKMKMKIGETCPVNTNRCDVGLRCETCPANGNTRPRCSRIRPTNPTSKVKNLPFNKYSWVTTHNSYAISGAKSLVGPIIVSPTNQVDSITSQLKNGVRGLMLDMYDFNNDVWLCHSFLGRCTQFTAFQPAINALREIRTFLAQNPSEIVTIFIEDYVSSRRGLTRVFNSSGLFRFWFPVSRMPENGGDWPTVDDMIRRNHRLVVFSSKSSKQASEGIAYQWRFVVENQYGDGGMVDGSCPSRGESSALNTTTKSLVLQNYFPDNPNTTRVCVDNSDALVGMMNTCYQAAGKRWPNFIAVDFYQRSDGGGVALVVDEANGHLTCGCDNIAYCRANSTFGTCDIPQMSPPPPAALPIENTTHVGMAASCTVQAVSTLWLSFLLLIILL